MKVSLACWPQRLPGGDAGLFARVAQTADRAGLYSIHLGEHVVIGNRLDRYPFGVFADPPDAPWPDPLVSLAAAAAMTTRIRLSTGALLAPLRPPALLAKELATLDAVSGGRAEPVFGVGWQREEFVASGVVWEQRYERLDMSLRICRQAWTGEEFTIGAPPGEQVTVRSLPTPVQPRLPVLLGAAATPSNARRIAEYCDGWCPIENDPEAVRAGIAVIGRAFDAAGRDRRELLVRAPARLALTGTGRIDVRATFDHAERLRTAGATVVAVGPTVGCRTFEEITELIHAIAEESARRG